MNESLEAGRRAVFAPDRRGWVPRLGRKLVQRIMGVHIVFDEAFQRL